MGPPPGLTPGGLRVFIRRNTRIAHLVTSGATTVHRAIASLRQIEFLATNFRRDTIKAYPFALSFPKGGADKPFMVRQAHHERLNLSRLKLVAGKKQVS